MPKVIGDARPKTGNYGAGNGGASHHTGGAIMGNDPKTSAVNRYLQSWDASNLFVIGGVGIPAEPRPQSDRHDRRAGLLGGGEDHVGLFEVAGSAGEGVGKPFSRAPSTRHSKSYSCAACSAS